MISGSKPDEPQSMRRSSSQEVTCEPRSPIFQWRIFAARSGSARNTVSSPTRRSVSGTPAFESTPTRASICAPGRGDRSPSTTPVARPSSIEDPVDRRVGHDRAAVLEEALGERVHLDLVPAHPDAGRVVEREGDAVGALAARERRAVLPEGDRRHEHLPARVGLEGALAQLGAGHLRHLLDARSPWRTRRSRRCGSSFDGSGCGVNEQSSLNSTSVSCTRSWTAEHPLAVAAASACAKFSAVRAGLLADQAVRPVAEGGGQDHRARLEAKAVAPRGRGPRSPASCRRSSRPREGCRASPPTSHGSSRRSRARSSPRRSARRGRPSAGRRPRAGRPTGRRRRRPRRIRPSSVAQLMPLARCGRISRHERRGHARRDRHGRRKRHRRRDLRTAGRPRVACGRARPRAVRAPSCRSRWT